MSASTIGELVLYLNGRAAEEGRIIEVDETASEALSTIRRGLSTRARYLQRKGRELPLGARIGLELRQGSVNLPEAKRIRQSALSRLRDYAAFLRIAEELGYTPQVLRAALTLHYEQLDREALGSDANCILLDIQQGAATLDRMPRRPDEPKPSEVIGLLASGRGPQEVGTHFSSNGSRLVGRVLKQLSLVLEGNSYEQDETQAGYRSR